MSTPSTALQARPHTRFPGFMGKETAAQFLAFAQEGPDRMEPTRIGSPDGYRHDAALRRSLVRRDLGTLRATLKARVHAVLPTALERLGMPSFTPAEIQTELVAHGDGGFYGPHLDTSFGPPSPSGPRRLTLVYYVHTQPRAFSGGALRLMALNGTESTDIEPEHDLAVAFPSWLPHQVLPVSLPSGDFAGSRFAFNVWMLG